MKQAIGDVVKSQRFRKAAIVTAIAAFMLVLGVIAGFFISKAVGSRAIQQQQLQTGSGGISSASGAAGLRRGVNGEIAERLAAGRLLQWPDPASAAAQQLLQDPQARTDGLLLAMYTWANDTALISQNATEAFLQHLLQQMNEGASGSSSSSSQSLPMPPPTKDIIEGIDLCMAVSRDVLAYMREHSSRAMLKMLRDYSKQGVMTTSDIDPDVLKAEMNELLNVTALNHWYGSTAGKDTKEGVMTPWRTAAAAQATPQLLQANANAGRRLLNAAQLIEPAAARVSSLNPKAYWRRLQATNSIPEITSDVAAKESVIPTVSPLLTLNDMLCAVESFSPTGLEGITMPTAAEFKSAGVTANPSSGKPITCPPLPTLGSFHHGGVVFKPVVIPVVFHCQRFMQGDVLQPPIWNPEAAGQNLIDVTNKYYKRTGIQFKLQEVRHDVAKYPYLLLSSLEDWQSCTGNPGQEAAGFPCLQETAKFPEVSTLAEDHVVNVFIGGSQTSLFCDTKAADTICSTLYFGYTGSIGPWFTKASPTWREGLSEENWVVMTWDFFAPEVANSKRFWNGGAVTLAHELGHYLGIMHTHEGASPCEGEGLTKADAVPDTPVNRQVEQWAAENNLAANLARWCSEFREGKKPAAKDLLEYNSCKADGSTDNVFNLMSYLPNVCNMMLSPNQVARLQWAVATFRPKMMAAYST